MFDYARVGSCDGALTMRHIVRQSFAVAVSKSAIIMETP